MVLNKSGIKDEYKTLKYLKVTYMCTIQQNEIKKLFNYYLENKDPPNDQMSE